MIKSKHVVQAQRKFAVGAIVPAQPERRTEPTPAALPPPEPGNVRYCGMTAMQLIDVVMMGGIHTHKVSQPVVVLERLNENDNDSLQMRIENVRKLKAAPKVAKKLKSEKKKDSPSKQTSCRSLRSQIVNTTGGRKRNRSESSVTDIEDNRPLKFLRKNNRGISHKKYLAEITKSPSTKLKRVSLRQIKLQKMSKKNERRVEKAVVLPKITKTIKPRKKGSSKVPTKVQASTSLIRTRTAPHTRARHDMTIAQPAPPPPSPAIVKRSPDKVKTSKTTQFRTPRPRRRARLEVNGDKSRSDNSNVHAMGDNERKAKERVVAGLVKGDQRSPSVRLHPLSCPKTPVLLSKMFEIIDTNQVAANENPAVSAPDNLAVTLPDNLGVTAHDDNAAVTDDYADAETDDYAVAETDDYVVAETDDFPVAEIDDCANTETDDFAITETDDFAITETDDFAVKETDDFAVTETDNHAIAETDDHAVAVTDDHAASVFDNHMVTASDEDGNHAVTTLDNHAAATPDNHAAATPDNHAAAAADDREVAATDVHTVASPDKKAAATLDIHAVAATDVYVFNDDSEAEAGPSSFRATRPRSVSRAVPRPPRSLSLDNSQTKNKSDNDCITRMLDFHVKALTTYAKNSRIGSVGKQRALAQAVDVLTKCKFTMAMDETESLTDVKETVVIDDDDDDDVQSHGTDSPRPTTPAELVDKEGDGPEIPEAPVFYPTKEEMRDLNSYIEKKIDAGARNCGIYKIVPPRDFQPPCHLKNVQFKSTNQYVSSMYSRWGPASSEMAAIKAHLATQNVAFTRPPLYEGVEVDLVKLHELVQEQGGLIRVMEERKWTAIAEKMQLNARAGRVKATVKLDKIYMKHLLPYGSLSENERMEVRDRVAAAWRMRYKRLRARAARPLHRQRRLLGESDSSNDDEEPEPRELSNAFFEVEDCVVPGPNMNLTRFRRVGERVRDMRFPGASSDAPPHWAAVERAYWRLVRCGTEHVCVHGAALDTSQDDLGFPAAIDEPYGNHPWNLKRLGESDTNVLSALGPTLAVTVPTLHLGMMFSTNCWHNDPHHLPWTEYMHQGAPKIWYGISDKESNAFRKAAERLCPTIVQRKALWLPSDTAMMPPRKLMGHGVRLVRTLQAPGEYVVVLPRAFSCSISTGFTVSESMYFASDTWLDGVDKVFDALRADAEPSMFALEALLEGVVQSPSTKLPRLLRARALLRPMLHAEMARRREAAALGIRALTPREFLRENRRSSKTSWQVTRTECHVCRATLHWSKMVEVSARVSVCLEHGLRMVRGRNSGAKQNAGTDEAPTAKTFMTILFYSDQEISQLNTDLDNVIH